MDRTETSKRILAVLAQFLLHVVGKRVHLVVLHVQQGRPLRIHSSVFKLVGSQSAISVSKLVREGKKERKSLYYLKESAT